MSDDKPRRRRRRRKRPVKWKGGRSGSRKNYRTPEYIETIAYAETGIYRAFVASRYEITDHDVRQSIHALIRELRDRGYTLADERDVVEVGEEFTEDLVTWMIKMSWGDLFDQRPHHSDEDLIGCLGVILDSIETWSTPASDSRGYLWYCAGFVQRMGVWATRVPSSPDQEAAWEEEETDEDILRELGEVWLDRPNSKNSQAFQQKGREMLDDRQAQEVINACQYLIGQTNEEAVIEKLVPLLQPAYRQLGVPFRHPGRR